ncbi:hypothetical protein BDR26DRAFT_874833 [Obelidium mucronatum]|nr:hypothetical protein BDR26DRAFT_874833 [Obelidium mucronatum]
MRDASHSSEERPDTPEQPIPTLAGKVHLLIDAEILQGLTPEAVRACASRMCRLAHQKYSGLNSLAVTAHIELSHQQRRALVDYGAAMVRTGTRKLLANAIVNALMDLAVSSKRGDAIVVATDNLQAQDALRSLMAQQRFVVLVLLEPGATRIGRVCARVHPSLPVGRSCQRRTARERRTEPCRVSREALARTSLRLDSHRHHRG